MDSKDQKSSEKSLPKKQKNNTNKIINDENVGLQQLQKRPSNNTNIRDNLAADNQISNQDNIIDLGSPNKNFHNNNIKPTDAKENDNNFDNDNHSISSPKESLKPQSDSLLSARSDSKLDDNKNLEQIKRPKSQKNPKLNVNKNPSKHLPQNKKYSKNFAGTTNDNQSQNDNKTLKKKSLLKKALDSKADESPTENSDEDSVGLQTINNLIGGVKKVASFVMTVLSSLPLISTFAIVVLVVFIVVIVIIPIIASLQPYGEDGDGNVCFATAPCTNVVIKNGEEEKKYKLEEYIAGAMVEYYTYSDVAKYSILGSSINDNLLKALAVIIHSDISIYSDYDASTSTCTVTQSSKFKDVYEPASSESESDVSDSTEDESTSEDADSQESTQDQNTSNNQNDSTSNNNQTDNDKYYYQAKNAAKSVISQVVNVYSTNLDLKYSGYLQVLHNAADANQDYQKILKAYIKNNPNYISAGSTAGDIDNQEETDTGDSIGIYPICYFEEKSDSDISVVHSNDVCSTVHVNNGSNTGDYTLDKFIEGVVYNEARAWTDSIDTLKAHAVAARTYLVNRAKVENGTCYMTVGGNTMGFSNNTNDAIHQAVTETSGEYIMVNGKISKEAEWDALAISDGYYTNTSSPYYTLKQKNQQIPKSWINSVTLFYSIPDYIRLSHGRGMSQYGAYYLATVQNYSYKDIIKYYYDADISIVSSKEYIMPLNSFTYISGELHSRCNGKTDTHKGIDLAAPKGTPVYAAHSGTVKSFYNTNYQCAENCKSGEKEGLGVKIDNGDGTYSLYMHFSKRENLVIGQKVEAGQKLGEVGNTGSAQPAGRGYHLHYQMVRASDGVVLNPRDYLPLDEKGYGVCYDPR